MNNSRTRKSGISRSLTMLGGIFMISLQMLAGKANAQTLAHYTATNGTGTAVTTTTNATVTALTNSGLTVSGPCSSGGYSGVINNGVTTFSTSNGHLYFTVTADPGYVLNVTDFTCKLRRSNSGIQKVRMAYTTGSGIINDLVDKAPVNTSCGGGTTTVFSWATAGGGALPTGVTSFTAELFPYAPVSSGGNAQFNDITVSGTVSVSGSACPGSLASGTVTPTSASVCAGTPTTLTLAGASTGSAVAYQWQSSPDGSTWTNVGTNATSYTAPDASAATTFYQAVTTCTVTSTTATSSSATVTVNANPNAGAIAPLNAAIVEGSTLSMDNTTYSGGTGVWSSGTTTIGDFTNPFAVPASFVASASHTGTSLVTFTVTDGTTGCSSSTSTNVSVIYAGDLALYQGTGGNSTSVITIADVSASPLTNIGYGATTPCTTGGLSGLTVNTTVVTYDPAGLSPHVSYTITPSSLHALNINEFHVSTRSSGTGATRGILGYRVTGSSWVFEAADHVLATGGSCGANSTSWYWNLPAALTGITTDVEVAFFAYASGSNSGTVQVNQFEALGSVTTSTPCSGVPSAGTVTPSSTVVCNSGYAFLTFAGDAGVNISYQWLQDLHDGFGFNPISGANNVYYTSPVYTVTGTNIDYEMVTTCATGTPTTNVSPASNFIVTTVPAAITGIPSTLIAGTTVTLNSTPSGGTWTSQHFDVASAGSATGEVTGIIPGYTKITYTTAGFSCFVTATVNVTDPNTVAVYLGTGGNSTLVTTVAPVTASAVAPVGSFLSTTPTCTGSGLVGGISGLTVDPSIMSWVGTNPYVGYTITPNAGYTMSLTQINATVRSSNTGAQTVVMAYSTNGGSSWDATSAPITITDFISCGVSTVELQFPVTLTTTANVLVAIFPYNAMTSGGTFQLNTMDVQGNVCTTPGAITNTTQSGANLDLEIFGSTCPDQTLDATPSGGTWSYVNVDPLNPAGSVSAGGILSFDPSVVGTQTLTVTYTTACGLTTTANVLVNDNPFPLCDGASPRPAGQSAAAAAVSDVTIYPNPASNVLNIVSADKVNVIILAMDGRSLISKNGVKSVDVSSLASGAYMIQVYNAKNTLIKTAKFTKE
jgi:hypothetical protein